MSFFERPSAVRRNRAEWSVGGSESAFVSEWLCSDRPSDRESEVAAFGVVGGSACERE